MILDSEYSPSWPLRLPHVQTIVPTVLRTRYPISYARERIATPDDDFLDLDWCLEGNDKLVIISHGLEGHSKSKYVLGMVQSFRSAGWDVLAWNFRGCSGEPNSLVSSYHSGKSEDLRLVTEHVLDSKDYQQIGLVGFSIGGNITLKYLGEEGGKVPRPIIGSVNLSVPCHLESSARLLSRWSNKIYMERFLHFLRAKLRAKAVKFPGELDISGLRRIRSFIEFDERFTAPQNGFHSATHYWHEASSLQFLPEVSVPSLLLSARDDSFLSPECYPEKLASRSPYLHLEMPKFGGHVGFMEDSLHGTYWSERRAVEFLGGFVS